MAFEVGNKYGQGRPKGRPNKSTETAKKAIAAFINDTSPEVIDLWNQVAMEDPAKAIDLWTKLAEYVIPKQSRVAHVGEGESDPITIVLPDSWAKTEKDK